MNLLLRFLINYPNSLPESEALSPEEDECNNTKAVIAKF